MCRLRADGFRVVANFLDGVDDVEKWRATLAQDEITDIETAAGDVSSWESCTCLSYFYI